MPEYRRWRLAGATYFFTVVTDRRRPILDDPIAVGYLRRSIRQERKRRPFAINAMVVLPDHFHMLMTLPEGDADYSTRTNQIKRQFTMLIGGRRSSLPGRNRKRLADVWQPRFWEHVVRDDDELAAFGDYIHYNPVKHGYVRCPHEWRWSSYRHWVRWRWLEPTWACSCHNPASISLAPFLDDLCGEPNEFW